MNEDRKFLIAAAASIARLQLRVYRQNTSSRKLPNGHWELAPKWKVVDLDPPSPWLQNCPGQLGLDSLLLHIMEAQMYLLAVIDGNGPIDKRLALRALQHMSGDPVVWTDPVKRLAKHLEIELDMAPTLLFNHAGLFCTPLPGSTTAPRP
jgi:hypothetical protein